MPKDQKFNKFKAVRTSLLFLLFFATGLITFQNCSGIDLLNITGSSTDPDAPSILECSNSKCVRAPFLSDQCPTRAIVQTPEWVRPKNEVSTQVTSCNLVNLQEHPDGVSTALFEVPPEIRENYRTIQYYFTDNNGTHFSIPKKVELRPRLFNFQRLGIGYNIPSLIGSFTNLRNVPSVQRDMYLSLVKKAIADAYRSGAQHVVVLTPGYLPLVGTDMQNQRNDLALWVEGHYEMNAEKKEAYWNQFDLMINEIAKYGLGIVLRGWTEGTMFPNFVNYYEETQETIHDFLTRPESKSYKLYLKYWQELIERYRDVPEVIAVGLPNELNLGADLAMNYRCEQQPIEDCKKLKTDSEISECIAKIDKAVVHKACSVFAEYSSDELAQFFQRVVPLLSEWGSHRSSALYPLPPLEVIAGTGNVRGGAQHMRLTPERAVHSTDANGNDIVTVTGPDWGPDSKEEFIKYVRDLFAPFHAVDLHIYNGNTGDWSPGWLDLNRFPEPSSDCYRIEVAYAADPSDPNLQSKYNSCRLSTRFVELAHEEFAKPENGINKSLYIGELGEGQADGVETYPFTQKVIDLISKNNRINASVWALEFFQFNTFTYQNGGENLPQLALDLGNPKVTPLFQKMIQKRKELMDDSRFPSGGNKLAQGVQTLITHPFHESVLFPSDPNYQKDKVPLINVVASSFNQETGNIIEIEKVEVWVDNKYYLLSQFPFQIPDPGFAPGAHMIKAKATDKSGNSATHSIKVHVEGPNSPDTDVVIYNMGVGGECSKTCKVGEACPHQCGVWTNTLNVLSTERLKILAYEDRNKTRPLPDINLGGYVPGGNDNPRTSTITFGMDRILLLKGFYLEVVVNAGTANEKKSNLIYYSW